VVRIVCITRKTVSRNTVGGTTTTSLIADGTRRYDAFGNLLSWSGAQTVQPYRFSSKAQHSNSGLIDFGFRFYSPELGRFLNRDPIGEAGGINLYGFVGNSPTNAVDPYGEKLRDIVMRAPIVGPFLQKHGDIVPRTLDKVVGAASRAGNAIGNLFGRGGGQAAQQAAQRGAQCSPRTITIKPLGDGLSELVGQGPKGEIRMLAEIVRQGNDLILRGAHIEGPGAGSVGIRELAEFAKQFGREQGVQRIIIEGAKRTTGTNPGHMPRPFIFKVE